MVKPAHKREALKQMTSGYQLSIRQACSLINFCRSSVYYRVRKRDDGAIIEALNNLAELHPTYGFRKMYHTLKNAGHTWNHKRVRRVYRQLGLNLIRKRKRRLPNRERNPLKVPMQMNQTWSMDFMSDALWSGRRFRTLNIIDDFNREAIWIETAMAVGAKHLTNLLEWLIGERGKPKAIRVDNGPEFTSITFTHWCHKRRIALLYIQPGKPVQNALIERFNRSYRTEVLDCQVFHSMIQVRERTNQWIEHYNRHRPHESLGNKSPIDYATNPQGRALGGKDNQNNKKSISLKM